MSGAGCGAADSAGTEFAAGGGSDELADDDAGVFVAGPPSFANLLMRIYSESIISDNT